MVRDDQDCVRGAPVALGEQDHVATHDLASLSVDESALTGESVPFRKARAGPGSAQDPMGRPGPPTP